MKRTVCYHAFPENGFLNYLSTQGKIDSVDRVDTEYPFL